MPAVPFFLVLINGRKFAGVAETFDHDETLVSAHLGDGLLE